MKESMQKLSAKKRLVVQARFDELLDDLHEENMGASLYASSQGLPLTIWGLFGNGRLQYYVRPVDKSKLSELDSHSTTTKENASDAAPGLPK